MKNKDTMFWNAFCAECDKINKKPNPVGKEIGVSSATIAKWKSGTIPNGETLVRIADYFEVSVDYLLGREDKSEDTNKNQTNMIQPSDIYYVDGDNNDVQFNSGTVTFNKSSDEMTTELIEMFKNLTTLQKAKVIIMINDLKNETKGA
ncbi:MAG: helix-turn-helix domain-containing protein [Allobaculum sp.]|nr:helix-turn-helix domain-containing protein [Allobaculum sp.]